MVVPTGGSVWATCSPPRLLEMTSTNRHSGENVTMRVTNIDTNAHVTYAMADYPKMELGKK